ncbi:MAG: nitroreductase family protein [Treponema sp.]|jgi:nitroreductase|nr:nitroreductase family protein [Treponema sp.]
MKKIVFVSVFLIWMAIGVSAQDSGAAFAVNHYAARNFISGALTAAELDTVLQAGISAPSARNRQPWHFTVVRNQALAKRIVPDVSDGNVLIIVSAAGDGRTNGAEILDCALAAQSIYLAAQAIGLGSRIYTGPIDAVNRNLKGDLGFPAGHSAVVLVRVGKVRTVDAASSASGRKAASALVTYK